MFFYRNFLLVYKKLIKINIEVVRKRVWVLHYTRYPVEMGMRQKFNTRYEINFCNVIQKFK